MNFMTIPNFTKEHADQILAHVNVEVIRARKFKVAVDMINASASVMDPYLFGNLGINLATSQMTADIAKKYGGKVVRSMIGEGHVVDAILSHRAIIGGEGNGGVIYPTINTVRDSFTTLSLILELLAERKQTVSEVVASLPKYFMKKEKLPIGKNLNDIYKNLKSNFKEAEANEQEGLRLDFPDSSWFHIRSSNTEPIIRIFGEAKEENRIVTLFEKIKSYI